MSAMRQSDLIASLLTEQRTLATPVADFSRQNAAAPHATATWRKLIPLSRPQPGEQYAFEVDVDRCTSCQACVVACHRLNGLDASESWRDVDILLNAPGPSAPSRQAITRACHHCADPACAHGCPTLAYEKDAETGVVRHLDDQCIGCSYCVMKCPYDVPKYNARLGIVRKCDMCHSRLAEGEAPACVQACPNEAIAIRVVKIETQQLYPTAYPPGYTRPQSRYVSAEPIPESTIDTPLRPATGHTPLAIMLVLTQAAWGGFVASAFGWPCAWIALALLLAGLGASTAHLGQPLKAWKAVLGWRRSWLSREIMAFGGFAGAGLGAALGLLPAWLAVAVGTTGIAASIMVYVDTKRRWWSLPHTSFLFLGSALLFASTALTCFVPAFAPLTAALIVAKVGLECGWLRVPHAESASLIRGPLRRLQQQRWVGAGLGLILIFGAPPWAAAALIFGEICERSLFFKAVRS
jgi:formate dehydrogenase iron-sulfur subunit